MHLLGLHEYVTNTPAHTHPSLMVLLTGLPRWAGTRKMKPIWILLKQGTVSGSGISWAICKSAPCSRQTTMPTPHHSFFTGRMPFLPPNQQRQSTEGSTISAISRIQINLLHQTHSYYHCRKTYLRNKTIEILTFQRIHITQLSTLNNHQTYQWLKDKLWINDRLM